MSELIRNIKYNGNSGRYEIDGKDLTCGTCISLYFDFEWHSARVEAEDGKYFAFVFDEGKKPYKVSLDFACWGSFRADLGE